MAAVGSVGEGRGERELRARWSAALELLRDDLHRRDAALRTRRAYAADLEQFARWAHARGRAPAEIGVRDVRRYVAGLSQAGAAPASTARKLAAIRGLFSSQREHGLIASNPADLVATPRQPSRLPRVLKAGEAARLLESIPGSTHAGHTREATARPELELRDRAMFELAYACGLRAEEVVSLGLEDVDWDGEQLRVEGKGRKTRYVPVGELAMTALRAYGAQARPALARLRRRQHPLRRSGGCHLRRMSNNGHGVQRRWGTVHKERMHRCPRTRRATDAAVPEQVGQTPEHQRRAPTPAQVDGPRGRGRRSLAAHPAPQLRHAPAGRRRGPAQHPRATRPRQRLDDAGIHSGRVRQAEKRLCTQPPSSLTTRSKALETNVKTVELRDLWRRYKSDGDRRARERLVVAYSPLVKYVAGRTAAGLPPHVEEADLISYGLVGLISAIERFDPSREIKFETYAITRIKGAIIDELRSMDWVPRSVRARAREIERANSKLEHRLQRAATDTELAAELGITEEELQQSLLAISHSSIAALDELWSVSDSSGDQVSLMDTLEDPGAPDPARALDMGDMKDRIADAIARLPEREKLVIALYYYENLTLREIGEVLGVTESRISQLHTKAVLRLRSRMQGDSFD